jgi:hypothetical protein
MFAFPENNRVIPQLYGAYNLVAANFKMGLFNILKIKKSTRPSNPESTNDGHTIFYHEDDYRQVEIVPNDNLAELEEESKKVNNFATEHFDSSGYTDIYVRNDDNKTELKQLLIKPKDVEQKLEIIGLERIPNVTTGYGQTYREPHKDCIAFVMGYSAIYYDFKDEIVNSIWLTNHWSMDRKRLSECLHEIGKKWNLLLQDWNLTETVDLNDKQAIDDYLGTYNDNEK